MHLNSTSDAETRAAAMITGSAKVMAGKQHRCFHMRMFPRRNFHIVSVQRRWDKQCALE